MDRISDSFQSGASVDVIDANISAAHPQLVNRQLINFFDMNLIPNQRG
jgi:hypothetical protein